jgi:hypothetical protein
MLKSLSMNRQILVKQELTNDLYISIAQFQYNKGVCQHHFVTVDVGNPRLMCDHSLQKNTSSQ